MQAALDTWDAYMAAREDFAGAAALWALHADDAPMLLDGRIVRARELDLVALASSHVTALAGLQALGSGFSAGGPPTLEGWWPEPGCGLALLRVPDGRRGGELRVALGLVAADGGWRIAFATLADDAPADGFAAWRARAWAEFPFVPGQQAVPSRDWLDLGWRRRHRAPRPPLLIPPGMRFSCRGTTTCCRGHGLDIVVPAEAQAFVDALPAPLFGDGPPERALEPREDGSRLLKRGDQACRFLDGQGRCRIHAFLGSPVFPSCVLFPFHFTETEAGVAVSASLHCGTVRADAGDALEDRLDDLYFRLAHTGLTAMPAAPRLAPDRPVEAAVWAEAANEVAAALAMALPPAERLAAALRAIAARLGEPAPAPDATAKATALRELGWLIGHLAAGRARLGLDADVEAPVGATPADPGALARWLALLHHGRLSAYQRDLASATNELVVFYAAVLAVERAGATADALTALGGAASHLTLARVIGAIADSDPARRAQLGDPAWGLACLAALADQPSRISIQAP